MVWHGCMFPDPESQYECEMNEGCKQNRETCKARDKKPEGIAVELADCIIRILDWAGKEGVDMDAIIRKKMAYNRTRPYRHGGKLL